MKTEIKTKDYSNGQRQYETPHANGKRHGLSKWWHSNGQKSSETLYVNGIAHGLSKGWHENGQMMYEIPYVNGKLHGLEKWCSPNGSLGVLRKRHHDQMVWGIHFPSKEQIPADAEVELFFHLTPELT